MPILSFLEASAQRLYWTPWKHLVPNVSGHQRLDKLPAIFPSTSVLTSCIPTGGVSWWLFGCLVHKTCGERKKLPPNARHLVMNDDQHDVCHAVSTFRRMNPFKLPEGQNFRHPYPHHHWLIKNWLSRSLKSWICSTQKDPLLGCVSCWVKSRLAEVPHQQSLAPGYGLCT